MTGDTFGDIFYKHWRAAGGVLSSFFFVTLTLVGQNILLMLFLAILVQNFDEASINQQ